MGSLNLEGKCNVKSIIIVYSKIYTIKTMFIPALKASDFLIGNNRLTHHMCMVPTAKNKYMDIAPTIVSKYAVIFYSFISSLGELRGKLFNGCHCIALSHALQVPN